jgi:glycosyltransferase involved in cell wall biosynthesis
VIGPRPGSGRSAGRGARISVLHLITDAGPHPYFRTIVEHADHDRFELAVGCVGAAGQLQGEMRDKGIDTFALGADSRLGYPRATLSLARGLRRERVDVVQTHLIDACLVGLAAARLARTPVAIHTAHHSHELPFHGRRLVYAERLCTGLVSDRIIAPSESVATTLVEHARVPRRKIEVIPHGFDLERLDFASADREGVRQELGLDGATVLGAVGRSYWLKNHSALVRAFAALASDFPDARLVIVGHGDWRELASLARELSVGDRVVFTGPREDVPDLLAAFDIFVHPALAESFGMVIVEAMAMARPVVSTRVGIAPDAIEPGISGVLADGFDADALEQALRGMLSQRRRWLELGVEARRRAEAFPAAAMVKAYEALYLARRVPRMPP